jgi:acetylornithine deacetylase/succinyl-diaminopimelate desuccinylase-like protein
MNAWKEFQEANKDRFLQELLDLLRIPSVSAKSEHNDDMQACAKAVAKSLTDAGAQIATIYETEGHPIVYGEIIVNILTRFRWWLGNQNTFYFEFA